MEKKNNIEKNKLEKTKLQKTKLQKTIVQKTIVQKTIVQKTKVQKTKVQKKKLKYLFNFNTKKVNVLAKYINILIKRGEKARVELGFFNILRTIRKEKKKFLLSRYLVKVINEARPVLTFISKRRGSKIYRVPISISMRREIFQGVQWIIKETCGLKKGDYTRVLLNELLNISHKMGVAIRMKKKIT